MKLLQEKLAKYDAPQRAMAMGIYPYFREIQSDQDTEVLISGKKVLMFGSNAYLGLTNHPKVKEAAIEAIKKYGTGCAGSRFLNGTLDLHLQLEKRLAEFVGKEDAIVYSTGFQVNLGVVSCITGREDYILWDELDHASIIEGHRLSFSTKLKFKHNDMDSLEKQLQKCEPDKVKLIVYSTGFQVNLGVVSCITGREDYILWDELDHASIIEGHRLSFSTKLKFKHNDMDSLEKQLQKCEPDKVKLIVIDGVFSMEGDVAKLPEIVALAKKYNASVMVDEAHGIGVFGDHGRGTCNHFGVTNDVDLIMGTFSKSFASIGGFIASDEPVINYLRHHSRSYIFSASNTPAATAAANAALDIMLSEPERIQHLWDLTHYALDGFRNMGCEIGHTSTPIIPLFIRDNDLTFLIVKELFEAGIFVNPVVAPAVASEDTLIRFSLMATHTKEQLDYALETIHKVFKSHGLVD